MKYSELSTYLREVVEGNGLAFYHYTLDHVNEYQGNFPVAVAPPFLARARFPNTYPIIAIYEFDLLFILLDLIDPGSNRGEKEEVVSRMWDMANSILASLINHSQQGPYPMNRVEDVSIEPHMTVGWNAHLTAGVSLTLRYITEPTEICPDVNFHDIYHNEYHQ